MSSLSTSIKAIGHYIEQPAVIEKAGKWAGGLALGGAAALLGADTFKAQPQERKKVVIRDTLVLGATLLGTLLATRKFMMPFIKKSEIAEAREELVKVVDAFKTQYSPALRELMLKETKTKQEFKDIIEGMGREVRARISNNALAKKTLEQDLQKVLPVELEEGFWQSLGKMKNFFVVGGASIISGLLGGMAANKINGAKEGSTVKMVKEGIFQFIANIALCALGASVGISVVSTKFVKEHLAKMGMTGRFLRTGIIGAGLSLGILGGGAIANFIGQKWINPFFDKLEGKSPSPGTKRHVEFWDAILHLDDLPTALALAGVKILEPFIPLFFGFSGYRTGIGYRNTHAPQPAVPKDAATSSNLFAASSPATTSPLISNNRTNNRAFQGFYQQLQNQSVQA